MLISSSAALPWSEMVLPTLWQCRFFVVLRRIYECPKSSLVLVCRMRYSSDTHLITTRLFIVKYIFCFLWDFCKIRKCGIWQYALTVGVHLWLLWEKGRVQDSFSHALMGKLRCFKEAEDVHDSEILPALVFCEVRLLRTFIWLGLPRWLIVWLCVCSKTMTANIFRGRQIYTCNRGVWVKEGASADLVDSSNSKVASYRSNYNPNTKRSTMSWTLVNSAGAAGESGDLTCGITGTSNYTFHSSPTPNVVAMIDHRNSYSVSDHLEMRSLRVSLQRVTIVDAILWMHLECFLLNLISDGP